VRDSDFVRLIQKILVLQIIRLVFLYIEVNGCLY